MIIWRLVKQEKWYPNKYFDRVCMRTRFIFQLMLYEIMGRKRFLYLSRHQKKIFRSDFKVRFYLLKIFAENKLKQI